MQSLLISSILVITTGLCFIDAINPSNRIINGYETSIDKAPYIVQLRTMAGYTFCSGTLITPQYVVSAGHCFNEHFFRQIRVVGGVNSRTEHGIERAIESIDLHPDYNAVTMHTDLAIVKLDKPMTGKNIATVELCKQPLQAGDFVQIYGWGRISEKPEFPNKLHTARMSVLATAKCEEVFNKMVEKNMFCAYGDGGVSIFLGDSGAPVIYKGQFCGINSFVKEAGQMSAFTDVYALKQYIEEALEDKHVLDWDY